MIKSLPYPLRHGVKYVYGLLPPRIRYGRVFWETYKFLQESQWWSREKLEEYQFQQLRNLLNHAYENVPYYRRVFNEIGLKPENIQCFDDLKKLPCLTKDDFRKHFTELIARNIDVRNLPMARTSGTSGKPLQFYTAHDIQEKEWAFICHQWSRVGYRPGDARVEIRGPIREGKSRVEYDPVSKVLRLSPRIDNKEVAQYYLELITRFGAEYIHGYPSAIAFFAYTIKKHGLRVPFRLKAIFFASEIVYGWEREICGEVFNCRVFSHYGMAEQVALGAECEHSPFYHCLPQYGIVEIDPETNELICTGFLNYINPFIRYRTTDIATGVLPKCDKCGRQYFPILENIEGRIGDYIVTSHGLIGAGAGLDHPFKNLTSIRNTQIVQPLRNQVVVRIVPWQPKDEKLYRAEVEWLRTELQRILGDEMRIEIEEVEDLERTPSGKFKWIISKVSQGIRERGFDEICW